MKERREPIVGRAVRSQNDLHPVVRARALDEFLVFLRRMRALFGPSDDARPPTTGDRFRL